MSLKERTKYKTVVVSDLHLGIRDSKAREVVRFLKSLKCEKLILNGDIIDGWQLKKGGHWRKKHSRVFKTVLKMLERDETEVIYLRGNHDDFLDEVLPFEVGNFSIVRDHMHESNGKRYYVVHGDIFDSVTTNLKWVAKLGDVGYTLLLWFNRIYNNRRARQGLPYYSLSQRVKARVKGAVSFISDFETTLCEVARDKGCDGVIVGHIHTVANKHLDGIHYLNSGDWVESMTALVEDFEGNWDIVYYDAWLAARPARMPAKQHDMFADEHLALPQPLNQASGTTVNPPHGTGLQPIPTLAGDVHREISSPFPI